MPPENLATLLEQLQGHPDVIGLIRFGTQSEPNELIAGDYDLFVVLTQIDPAVRSLHFCVGAVPVDLNLITQDEFERVTPADLFRWRALRQGVILYDPLGVIAQAHTLLLEQIDDQETPLSDHTIATTRHWHRHMLDKVRNRTASMPAFCRYVLLTNCTQLIKSYFRVRCIPYQGETRAFHYLNSHEPAIFATLTAYLDTNDLAKQVELLTQLAEQILAPIGGLWRHDELLAFGIDTADNLQVRGRQLFTTLFGETPVQP